MPLSCATPPKQTEVWTILVHTVMTRDGLKLKHLTTAQHGISGDVKRLTEIRTTIKAHIGLL